MRPYPFDSSQGNFRDCDLVKEYTSEELYEIYASENKIPEAVENYINDLEKQIQKLRNELNSYTTRKDN